MIATPLQLVAGCWCKLNGVIWLNVEAKFSGASTATIHYQITLLFNLFFIIFVVFNGSFLSISHHCPNKSFMFYRYSIFFILQKETQTTSEGKRETMQSHVNELPGNINVV